MDRRGAESGARSVALAADLRRAPHATRASEADVGESCDELTSGRSTGHRRAPALLAYVALVALLGAAACGYHVVGTSPQLPEDIRAIGVGAIENDSNERGLEKDLAFAFEREIHVRRHYRMAQSVDEADAWIVGRIRDVRRRPVAFDESDQAVQYELTIWMDLALDRVGGGERLWAVENLRMTDEYASNPRVVITSSSDFLQGGLDAVDVPRVPNDGVPDARQIRTIQLAESERRTALRRLVQATARQIYNRMIEGF